MPRTLYLSPWILCQIPLQLRVIMNLMSSKLRCACLRMFVFPASMVALSLFGLGTAHASLLGDTVTCVDLSSTSIFQCNQATATVNSGVEFSLAGGNLSLTEDFTATGLELRFTTTTPFSFNLTELENTDTTHPFTAMTVQSITGFANFTPSDVTLTSGTLDINLVGSSAGAGTSTIDLNLSTAAAITPEPTSLALLGTGCMIGLGFAGRRLSSAVGR